MVNILNMDEYGWIWWNWWRSKQLVLPSETWILGARRANSFRMKATTNTGEQYQHLFNRGSSIQYNQYRHCTYGMTPHQISPYHQLPSCDDEISLRTPARASSEEEFGPRPSTSCCKLHSSKWLWWCALSKQAQTTWTWNQHAANISKQWSKTKLLSCCQNPDDFGSTRYSFFRHFFCEPFAVWAFSFVASMCLKSTFASFRGKTLEKKPRVPLSETHTLSSDSTCFFFNGPYFGGIIIVANRGNTLDWHDWHCIWWPVATVVVGDRWPVGLWLVVAGWFLQSALRKIRSKNPLINFSLNKFLGGCAIAASRGFRGSFAKLLQIFGLYRNVWIILLHGSRYIWGSYYMLLSKSKHIFNHINQDFDLENLFRELSRKQIFAQVLANLLQTWF